MKCDEVQPLHGPYLDSELDAKTTLEIEQHLAACPACARLFAEEEKLEARIMAGLNRGRRTAALWEQIEHSVVAAAPLYPDLLAGCEDLTQRRRESQRVAESRLSRRFSAFLCVSALRPVWLRLRFGRVALFASPALVSPSVGWRAALGTLGDQLRAGWQTSRWAWTGLVVVWVGIVALNLAAREPNAPLVARQDVPSPSEMRFALKQKQLLMAELAVTSEPAPADKPKAAPPSPHSERRNETLNA